MMQPREANKFSMRSKTGVGGQVPGHGKSRASPAPRSRDVASDRVGYLMVLPYILHLGVFLGYPLAFAFVLDHHCDSPLAGDAVIDTVVPVGPADLWTLAFSWCASASTMLVPSPV